MGYRREFVYLLLTFPKDYIGVYSDYIGLWGLGFTVYKRDIWYIRVR